MELRTFKTLSVAPQRLYSNIYQAYIAEKKKEQGKSYSLNSVRASYAKISEAEIAKLQKLVDAETNRYNEAVFHYENKINNRGKVNYTAPKEFPEKPKKPINSYFRFISDVKEEYIKKHKDLAYSQVLAILTEDYNKLPEKAMKVYRDEEEKEKEDYLIKIKKWKAKYDPKESKQKRRVARKPKSDSNSRSSSKNSTKSSTSRSKSRKDNSRQARTKIQSKGNASAKPSEKPASNTQQNSVSSNKNESKKTNVENKSALNKLSQEDKSSRNNSLKGQAAGASKIKPFNNSTSQTRTSNSSNRSQSVSNVTKNGKDAAAAGKPTKNQPAVNAAATGKESKKSGSDSLGKNTLSESKGRSTSQSKGKADSSSKNKQTNDAGKTSRGRSVDMKKEDDTNTARSQRTPSTSARKNSGVQDRSKTRSLSKKKMEPEAAVTASSESKGKKKSKESKSATSASKKARKAAGN